MKVPQFVHNVRKATLERSSRFSFSKLHYTQNGTERFWEIMRSDRHRTGILLYDTSTDNFVLTKKFRPALLTRECRLGPEGQSVPTARCHTTELFSCTAHAEAKLGPVLESVQEGLGVQLHESDVSKVTSFTVWGEKYHLFYSEIREVSRPDPLSNIHMLPSDSIDDFLRLTEPMGSELCLALQWWRWRKLNGG